MSRPSFVMLVSIEDLAGGTPIPIPLFLVGWILDIALVITYIYLKKNPQQFPQNGSSLLANLQPRDLWKLRDLYKAIRHAGPFDLIHINDKIKIRFL